MRIIPCLIVLAACGASASEPKTPAERALAAMFGENSPAGSAAHVEAVLTACDNDADKVKALIASDTFYEPFEPGWREIPTEVVDGETTYDMTFLVRVPKGYTPDRSWPMIIAAHGQEGDGKTISHLVSGLLGRQLDNYVLLAPTMPGEKNYSGREYQEQMFLKPLAWARRKLNIDDDRVLITGYSLGAHSTWHMGIMYPRLFAGAIAMAGIPVFEGAPITCGMYLENMSNLPLWAIWGEKDSVGKPYLSNVDICRQVTEQLEALGNANYTPTELPGRGHGGCTPTPQEFVKYLADKKRLSMPKQVKRVFHHPRHGRAYYIEATQVRDEPLDLSKKVSVQILSNSKPTPDQIRDALTERLREHLYWISAELRRDKNWLEVEASRVTSVRVMVMAGMFDLSKQQTIRFLRIRRKLDLKPSARCILEHYLATRDQTALVLNEVDLTARKTTVRFK